MELPTTKSLNMLLIVSDAVSHALKESYNSSIKQPIFKWHLEERVFVLLQKMDLSWFGQIPSDTQL